MTIVSWQGEADRALERIETGSVDLILTSPPKDDLEGDEAILNQESWLESMVRTIDSFGRVLSPRGTVIINLSDRRVGGKVSTKSIEFTMAMIQARWIWTEEFIWHKKNAHPGRYPGRFTCAYEKVLQFNRSPNYNWYPEAVMKPVGNWATDRLSRLSVKDFFRTHTRTSQGSMGRDISNWLGRKMVFPNNVIHTATVNRDAQVKGQWPKSLPEFFINLFTEPGMTVCDPFSGSGVVAIVAEELGRNSHEIDIRNPRADVEHHLQSRHEEFVGGIEQQ